MTNGIHDDLLHLAQPLDSLVMLDPNPNIGDVEAVKRSYERFGQRKPIVVRSTDRVIEAGNTQFAAASDLGWDSIACVLVDDDEATGLAFALADNRTADLGSQDDAALAALLQIVMDTDADLAAAASYGVDDLLALVAATATEDEDAHLDDVPTEAPQITEAGDLWLLGPHRILCGDCRNGDDVALALDGRTINLSFTSPPYADRRDYDPDSGFVPIKPDDYVEWYAPVSEHTATHIAEDGSMFINIKAQVTPDGLDTEPYVLDLVLAHVRRWGWHWATELCWERNGVPKRVTRRFKNQFEPIHQFARGDWKMRPEAVRHWSPNVPVAVGAGGEGADWAARQGTVGGYSPFATKPKRTGGHTGPMMNVQGDPNVNSTAGDTAGPGMAYPGNRLPTFAGSHEATGHSAAFPVGLPEFFVHAYTDAGDVVYDPFMGSGSTLLAAHRAQRIGVGIELSPRYVDIICKRFQRVTGIVPVRASTGAEVTFLDA
jgi:DNA modification methylase